LSDENNLVGGRLFVTVVTEPSNSLSTEGSYPRQFHLILGESRRTEIRVNVRRKVSSHPARIGRSAIVDSILRIPNNNLRQLFSP
jgi:hypothetical protein